ncbi:NTP transferase domain-containing protein [soil metagenome]
MLSFACVVLAAGAGTRFGAPKGAAIGPDGDTFAQTIARAAGVAGADPIVVVAHAAHAVPDGTRRVENPNPMSDPVASLRLGLAQLVNTDVDGTLVWPVDCPFVKSETVTVLVEATASRNALIAVPSYGARRGHPSWFARDVWPELMTVEDGGARAVIRRDEKRVLQVPVDDRGILADIDTRADLAEALSEWPT